MKNFSLSIRKKILIFLLLTVTLLSFSQNPHNLKEYLDVLYQGFPVYENELIIKEYTESIPGFSSEINIYDSARTDFRKDKFPDKAFTCKPLNTSFEHFYSYKWPTTKGTVNHSMSNLLTLFYGDSSSAKCKEQYDIITEQLKKLTSRNQSYDIIDGSSKSGIGYDFYVHKRSKFPIISIGLYYGSWTKSWSRIAIDYHKVLSK